MEPGNFCPAPVSERYDGVALDISRASGFPKFSQMPPPSVRMISPSAPSCTHTTHREGWGERRWGLGWGRVADLLCEEGGAEVLVDDGLHPLQPTLRRAHHRHPAPTAAHHEGVARAEHGLDLLDLEDGLRPRGGDHAAVVLAVRRHHPAQLRLRAPLSSGQRQRMGARKGGRTSFCSASSLV